ncbi:helix-turn-helix transcriptional regulator [Streptomyces somaliensis DSM 40738]|uniref:Transcriptional regulator n=1 Tax=Streptomyces somaliensis (strain ATCC 33201 / DSM 40738 / JCM 12659 / KCTC 9044 / NCTC 11332 / NRRL B-12077 / IP 733) TaxID=1134445 RepID=A0AA44DCG9_STRE0|nr:helix-turn-helix transcriptional regulator [Streptomyces somaliensis]MCQ0022195.1 helix-turn-helix transcriptional regulator [Streptomyces somaliensis DSM 40738]NKY14338.1 transcriptional regulator [Streptomyces somaliensis DSM 40738]
MKADHGEGGNGGANGTEAELSDSLRTFGAVLKALREESGLTQEEFAPRVRYSAAYVAKIEQGKRFPPADLPARAEEALGPVAAKVLTAAARSLTRRAVLASWFRQWAGIEEEAISLYAYECRAIPGLLQPEAYIRAIFDRRLPPASEEQIEREVASRLERQQIIATNQNTAFSFIIEESVVARRMGGHDVTKQVIDRLLEMSTRRNVEIQIMAAVQEDHCGIDGQMYLAETAAHQWLGYTEGQRSSNLISTPKDVSVLLQRYGKLRSQALNCRATVELLERMRGAL